MSEEVIPQQERTLEVVRQEYYKLCGISGDCIYQIENMKKDLKALQEKMTILNQEAAQLTEKAKKEEENGSH